MTVGIIATRPESRNRDRRSTRRYDVCLPLTAHRLVVKQTEPITGLTENISVGGIYFTTNQELMPGWGIDLNFVLPAEITHDTDVLIQAQGKVTRVNMKKTEDAGRVGVAMFIERYEIIRVKTVSERP